MMKKAFLMAACFGLCALLAGNRGAFASTLSMQGNSCSVMNSSGTTYNPTISGVNVVNNSSSTLYALCSLPVDNWGQVYSTVNVAGATQGNGMTPASWIWYGGAVYTGSCGGYVNPWMGWGCSWSGLSISGAFSIKSTLGPGAYQSMSVAY